MVKGVIHFPFIAKSDPVIVDTMVVIVISPIRSPGRVLKYLKPAVQVFNPLAMFISNAVKLIDFNLAETHDRNQDEKRQKGINGFHC